MILANWSTERPSPFGGLMGEPKTSAIAETRMQYINNFGIV
jgi:hypothetical protein